MIRSLRGQVEGLEEQVRQLKKALCPPFAYPVEWRLTAMEVTVLSVLMARTVATKAALLMALYDDPSEINPKNIDLIIWRLRQKLQPVEVSIEVVWGTGWRLDPEGRKKVQAVVDQNVA